MASFPHGAADGRRSADHLADHAEAELDWGAEHLQPPRPLIFVMLYARRGLAGLKRYAW